MMKHLRTYAAAAAALAASALLFAPALAQQPRPELDGAPRLSSDRDRNWDRDREWDRDRDRRPNFQHAQRDCSRAGIREAWDRNYYSAQYHDGPRMVEGRYGWELRGRMRLHSSRGHSYVDTVCDISRGNVRIEFRR